MKNKTRKRRSFKQLSNSQKAYAQQGQQPPPNFPPPGTKNPSKHKPTYSPYPRRGVHANAYPRQYVKPKGNQKHSKHTQPEGIESIVKDILGLILWVAKFIIVAGLASIIIGGIVGIEFFDLATGAISLASVFSYGTVVSGIPLGGGIFGMAVSFMTSLGQLVGWLTIEKRKKNKKNTGQDVILQVALYFIMFVDTLFDLGVLNLFVYNQDVLSFNPFTHGWMFGMLCVMLAIFLALGERLTVYILRFVEIMIDDWSL